METTLIRTKGSVQSDINLIYDVRDMSATNAATTISLCCAPYYLKYGYYPKKISIVSYNSPVTSTSSGAVTGLTLVDTYDEINGETTDVVYKYEYDCDKNVGSDYTVFKPVTDLKVNDTCTKLLLEDVGILYDMAVENTGIAFNLDYNRYLHFPKSPAPITGTIKNTSSWAYGSNIPQYMKLNLRYTRVTITVEQFLEMLHSVSFIQCTTGTSFKNGTPTLEEIINNISMDYLCAEPVPSGSSSSVINGNRDIAEDGSNGLRMTMTHTEYVSTDLEDVALLFARRVPEGKIFRVLYNTGSNHTIVIDKSGSTYTYTIDSGTPVEIDS